MAEQNVLEKKEVSKGQKFKAGLKEWGRKRIVALKRSPQTIPLLIMVITTVYFMLTLFNYSRAINLLQQAKDYTYATGICIFITTLLSLLFLVSFLNAFPKRSKPNIFFIALVFIMIAAQIACDLVYYIQMNNCLVAYEFNEQYDVVISAQPYIIVHVVLLAVSAVVFALLPVYSKLIKKIDTSVKLESATENMRGNIDIQED